MSEPVGGDEPVTASASDPGGDQEERKAVGVGFELPLVVVGLVALAGGLVAANRVVASQDFILIGAFAAKGWIPAFAGIVGAFIVSEQLSAPEMWLGRLSTVVLAATLLFGLMRARPPDAGRLLLLAATLHYGTAIATSVIMGTASPDYLQNAVLELLALVAVWAAPRLEARVIVAFAKIAVTITLIGTVVVVAVNAPEAWLLSDNSLIPGMPGRLQGATYHPNVLGPLPVLWLILEYHWPSHRWVRWPVSVLAGAALVLSVSQTSWVALFVVVTVLWALGSPRSRNVRFAASLAVIAALSGLLGWALFGAEYLASSTVDRVTTLTGRTELWRIGLEAWQRTPLTGAGPEFFETYATNSGQAWAGQAHNQIVQTLTEHGVIGLLTLVVYVVVMVQVAMRMSARTRATSLALVALLLVRCITETPLTGLTLEHLTIFALLIAWERASHAERAAGGRDRGAAGSPAALSADRTSVA